jgi:two-component system, OmpR family, phosphate regulon sensor histidine kinase PhoR
MCYRQIMSPRRPHSVPIILAIVMIALLGVLTVGWVLLNVFGALQARQHPGIYWILLTIGSLFMILLLAGTILYLILSIKAINLTSRQSNFIDSVTHELKSPLASMKLYLQTLSRRHVSPTEQADFHRAMLDDLDRLDRLINQMLAAGRADADRPAETIEDVDLAELLPQCAAAVCQSYRVPAETVRCDVSPCVIHARRTDLDVIFRNLIDNAVKYAGTPPDVEVSLHCWKDKYAMVHVADNGRGIPFAYRRKVFRRFVRLGSELERDKPGTGLGLYIVRTLVGRLRGRVRVRDRRLVPGTVFEVQLPLPKQRLP